MEHLIDRYLKKPELVKDLFTKEVSISLKVDGAAFQISYDKENDSITYHKRGGSSKSLGPIIDEYTQLMRKNINDAIDYFEAKKESVKKYKFYAIEMFNDSYILLTVIDNDDNIIDDRNKLEEISKSLGIDCVPILFEGKLNKEQIESLISMMTLEPETSNDVYKEYLTNIFGKGDYQKFLVGDEVEGIVLTWNIDNVISQYKIINPAFKTRHDKEIKQGNEDYKKEIEEYINLYKLIYETINKIGKHLDDNWIKNLNANFISMINNEEFKSKYEDIIDTLQPKFKDFFTLQINKASKEIQDIIKEYGDNMKFLYEKYLQVFFKQKKRNYFISKEFQLNVNKVIERLQKANESKLSNYIRRNIKSFGEYFIDEKLSINKDIKIDTTVYSLGTNKKLEIKQVANDKESWKKFESFVLQLNRFNLMKYSRIYLCSLDKNNRWVANTKISYSINDYQPNFRYLYASKNNYLTYQSVIDLLEEGDHIIILAGK